MAKAGRKSVMEEIQVKKRYASLSPLYFSFLKKMITSEDIENQKWATEQLGKAYVKMIPQTLAGDSENPIVISGVEISIRK